MKNALDPRSADTGLGGAGVPAAMLRVAKGRLAPLRRSKLAWFLLLSGASLVAALVANRYIPGFSVLFLGLFVTLLVVSQVGGRPMGLLYNASFLFFALGAFEFYSIYQHYFVQRPKEITWSTLSFETPLPELGWGVRLRNDSVRVAGMTRAGTQVFSVVYTFDEAGWRITPKKPGGPAFFFGDSLTFGYGVEDQQDFPYIYSELTGNRARNVAYNGYGPHHALRFLELGMDRKLEPNPPRFAVYTLIPSHVDRASGNHQWQSGPFYKVENGAAVYAGSITDHRRHVRQLFRILRNSYFLNAFVTPMIVRWYQEEDVGRLVAIVARVRDIIEKQHQGRFVLICWDVHPPYPWYSYSGEPGPEFDAALCNRIAAAGVRTIRLSEKVPEIRDLNLYLANDGHPGPRLYKAVAEMLAREMK